MRVDLIASDANLKRLSKTNETKELIKFFNIGKHEIIPFLKVLSLFEAFKIKWAIRDYCFCLDQVSFFCFIDLMMLLLIRSIDTTIDESYFDSWDIQAFRLHLFNSGRPTNEFERILCDLNFDKDNPTINNYNNTIEFKNKTTLKLFNLIGNYFEAFLYAEERLCILQAQQKNKGGLIL